MKNSIVKKLIVILICNNLLTGLSGQKLIECTNRNNSFVIHLPKSDRGKFIEVSEIDNGDLIIFENNLDSLTMLIYSSFNRAIFDELYDQKHYESTAFNYSETEKDIIINLEQKFEKDKVVLKYLYFNRLMDQDVLLDIYEVSFIYVLMDKIGQVRVEIKKSYSEFDLPKVLEWTENYDLISVEIRKPSN